VGTGPLAADAVESMRRTIRCVARTADVCGEGAVWRAADEAVYWTDINRRLIHRLRSSSAQVDTWTFDQPVTALALTTDDARLLVVLGGRVLLWDPATDARSEPIYILPGWPEVRANDARVGPDGVLWFGTMQNNVDKHGNTRPVTEHVGELISLDALGRTRSWLGRFGISNTVAWSPARDVMYFGDTLGNVIYECDFGAEKNITRQRVFTQGFERGLPDGSAMDSEGFLWNCRYGGGCIVRFAPSGEVDAVIDVPVPNPTTCVFGGADLRTLYFTSAGEGIQAAGPGAGGLFSMRVPVRGLPPTLFEL
jgi:sugar lactone lactonase YvrE